MTQFTVHTAESAPAASRPLLEGVGRSFGFVPNLFGVFAESPAALRGGLAIYDAFSTSSLGPGEQQLVMLAVSVANDCEYCVAAHSTLARRFAKVDPVLVGATRRGEPLADAKLDAPMKMFGQETTLRSSWVMTVTHLHEHLGQLIAYARSNKVVPPWSK